METTNKKIEMSDKDKADCLIELHREQLGHFKQTREIEWKVNLTLWSLIILGSYNLQKAHSVFLSSINLCSFVSIYFIVSVIIIIAHFKFWLEPILMSEKTDNDYILKYRKAVENLTKVEILPYKEFDEKKQKWAYFELGITGLVLFLAGIYLAMP